MSELLEFVDFEVTLDITEPYTPSEKMVFLQNNVNSAHVLFNFTKKRKPIDMTSVSVVYIAFKKSDGTLVYQGGATEVDKKNGRYSIVFDTQVLASVGRVYAHAHFVLGNKRIETRQMFFDVDKSFMSNETIESTNSFPIIQKAIEAGEKLDGKDIDGIILAGAKADTAIAKSNTNETQIGFLNNSVGKTIENYTNIQAALTAIGSQTATLTISKDTAVTANTTIPSNVTLKFVYPFKLNISNGVTLTINGGIEAGNYHIFGGVETNGSTANIAGNPLVSKIYARWFGAKLDNKADDTMALNKFFKLFGSAELVVDNGVAYTTDQLLIAGKWNPSNNNSSKRLTFKNSAINYQGVSGKACIQLFNHQKSVIDGLSVLKTSISTYVNIVAFWYSKLVNFDIPKLTFNKTTSDIVGTINTPDSYTSTFQKGVTALETEFYGVGTTGGGNINSISFKDVLWQGNQIGAAQYNLKFYGTSFQNMSFYECDVSYSKTANIYIDVAQLNTMRLNFYSCYFDSNVPVVEGHDFKGAAVNMHNNQLANSQKTYIKLKNFLSNISSGNYGLEAGSPKTGGLNLARNGDLLFTALTGWQFSGNETVSGSLGNPPASFLTNVNTINGNSLQVTFNQTTQYIGFNALSVPMDGTYSVAIRLKKIEGNGTLQLSFAPATSSYDLTSFANGEELLLTVNTAKVQGASMGVSLKCTNLSTAPLTIEIMEITIVAGANLGINLPLHPLAVVYPTAGTTASRPAPYKIGQTYFDTTLGKQINVKQISPAIWVDAMGTVV